MMINLYISKRVVEDNIFILIIMMKKRHSQQLVFCLPTMALIPPLATPMSENKNINHKIHIKSTTAGVSIGFWHANSGGCGE